MLLVGQASRRSWPQGKRPTSQAEPCRRDHNGSRCRRAYPCGPSIAGACRETRATQQGRLAGSALRCQRENWSREETTMNRAILGATPAGALVFVTSICWTQSWAHDQGRPPVPPALVGMGLPEVPPEQVGMSKQKLDRIHDALKQHVADGKLPGTVMLVARKGKLIYADVTGFQDKDEGKPMALDSLFRIYSMTKPLVSVAAMMLVEDGTIQLTDPVSKFFPAFKGQQVSVARSDNELARMSYIMVAAEREMTVQDLLRHTAGLAYGEITVNTPVRDAYAKAGLYLAGVRDYDARELTPAEEVERLAKAPLAHQPGTGWEYSMAVDLLGRVVEAASGKRLADFLDERVFKPLKMRDPAFWVPPGKLLLGTPGYTFGLGFAVRPSGGIAGVPGSAGEFMWAGYAGTYFWVDPKEELTAVYMSQAPSPIRAYYRKLVKQLAYGALTD